MKATISITVKNRAERDDIIRALALPEVLAFVKVIGALDGLASDRARARVLQFVIDSNDDQRAAAAP
jgi:hypothetical protein